MAKQPMTEEQKQVLRDRLAKARAAKAAKVPSVKAGTETPEPAVTISQTDFEDLRRQIEELKSGQFAQVLEAIHADRPQEEAASLESPRRQGENMVGAIEKWSVDVDRYPDPTPRLREEPKLQRFAFGINYQLTFKVTVTTYQTQDKQWMKEPRFYLELLRNDIDEETGEFNGDQIVASRLYMHEDMEAAVAIAREQGLAVETDDEASFMNEMRYLRIRDWLFDAFYPKPATTGRQTKEKVKGGKLVQVYEACVDAGAQHKIDWNQVQRQRTR